MLYYRRKVQLGKTLQRLVWMKAKAKNKTNTTHSPTPKRGNNSKKQPLSYQSPLQEGVPATTVIHNLDINTWELVQSDPLRKINTVKLQRQPRIRLGHRTSVSQHITRVAIKITVPQAMEHGGSSWSEVALENIQRKSQALLKAMQKADRKLYLLPFEYIDIPLNGNCSTIMKPEEFPADFDELQKYSPEF
jgi:hypothetical protein